MSNTATADDFGTDCFNYAVNDCELNSQIIRVALNIVENCSAPVGKVWPTVIPLYIGIVKALPCNRYLLITPKTTQLTAA